MAIGATGAIHIAHDTDAALPTIASPPQALMLNFEVCQTAKKRQVKRGEFQKSLVASDVIAWTPSRNTKTKISTTTQLP